MNYKICVMVILVCMLFVDTSLAAPTMTSAVSTNREAVFVGDCGSSPCWFSWGVGDNYYWTTPNQTITGAFTDTQLGAPMLTGLDYNVRACDATGCSAPMAFTVPAATMLPITHYGEDVIAIWRSGLNITRISEFIITPYAKVVSDTGDTWRGTGEGIIWGLFFFFIFVGYWLRGKNITMPTTLALLSGTFLIGASAASAVTGITISPVFVTMGMPLLILGLAGVFYSWFVQ